MEKAVVHESNDCANCNWCVRHIKRPGGLGSWQTGRDYPNDSIAKNGQNPETSPGDLRRFAVTQTPEKKSSANTDVKNSKGLKKITTTTTHKLLWDFNIHTDHLISTRIPDLIIIMNNNNKKKRTSKIVDLALPADHRIKLKEYEKKDTYLDLVR